MNGEQGSQAIGLGFTTTGADRDERLTFAAAAVTLGYDLAEGTPKISNCYDTQNRYEPGEPGDIRFYLPLLAHGININELIRVWKNPGAALDAAADLPERIDRANDAHTLAAVVEIAEETYLSAACAYMRLLSLGRVQNSPAMGAPTREERRAVEFLDTLTEALQSPEMTHDRHRRNYATKIVEHWPRAMFAWMRAYKGNLLELRNLWKEVPPAIKIERPGMKFPLVLEKGPRFQELLNKWT